MSRAIGTCAVERSGETAVRERPEPEEIARPELTYFGLQAYVGATKHMGALQATEELVELCHINEGKYVLDVGCGVGATPCYLAKRHGCNVVGVDISEGMIHRSNERARRHGVEDRVEFRVADARELPFEDALFDVVIGESVITFLGDKQGALNEYVRVTRPGGYVGLNEEIWLKTPPPPELVEYASRAWGIEAGIPTSDGWEELLGGSGLRDVVARTHRINVLRESSQIRRYRVADLLRMLYSAVSLYIRSPGFRKYMRETWSVPKNLFEYLGYGIYVGRK